MKKIITSLMAILAFFLIVIQCRDPVKQSTTSISVTASFYPLYYFASQIGGEKAAVTNITPPGAEPHDYEPTPRQIAAISSSKLLILTGAAFEPWAENIRSNLDTLKTKVIVISKMLVIQPKWSDGRKVIDPHFWLSPPMARYIVDQITREFILIDNINEAYYRANGDSLISKIKALDKEYSTALAHCETNVFMTSHDAFNYLGVTYGLKQIPIAGLSPDAEPSPKQLSDLAAFAKLNNIKYIFFESLVSPKLAQTLATEIGAQTLVLNPIEGLTKEELAGGEDYFSIMRANLANLEMALQCKM